MAISPSKNVLLTDALDVESINIFIPKSINSFDFSRRPKYKNIIEQIKLQGYNIRQLRADYLPTLYASVEFGYNSLSAKFSELGRWNEYFNYGLRLNLNIFDGFRKKSRILQEKHNLSKIQYQKEDLERAILLEQLQAKSALVNDISTLQIQKENIKLAEHIYQVSKIKYQQGIGSNQEVIDAQTSLKEAEINLYRIIFSALNSKVDYQLANGSLLEQIEN